MKKAYRFLLECGNGYLLTLSEGRPSGRPLGSFMEHEGHLYFGTAATKALYYQLLKNPDVQIVGLKPYTARWIRISGHVAEVYDLELKEKLMNEKPRIYAHFQDPDDPLFALFRLDDPFVEYM